MALLGQFRKIDMRLVFKYPLGPLPWAPADPFGLPRKTNKAKLAQQLENKVVIEDSYPHDTKSIYDGMAVLQKFKPPPGATFSVVAESLFAILTSNISKRIDIVFDINKDISIKNAERSKRATGPKGITYQNIFPGFQVKNWSKILNVSSYKTELVRFLVDQWKQKQYREKLRNKTLYVTEEETCWKISSTEERVVTELRSNQEEADTRMVLHAKHAGGKCVIHSEDTDVMVLLLGHAHNLGKCYMQKGKGLKRRIVGISEVANQLERRLADGITKQEACEALIGLHALTGCDTVSAFSSKGKLRPMQMLVKNGVKARTRLVRQKSSYVIYTEKRLRVWIHCDMSSILRKVERTHLKHCPLVSRRCGYTYLVQITRRLSGGELRKLALTSLPLMDMDGT